MKIRRAALAAVALVVLTTVVATPPASAGVWDPSPVGNGPSGSSTGTGGGGSIPCWNGFGASRGKIYFDRYYWRCEGAPPKLYPGRSVMFWGFEVWRFYGYRDAATQRPTRVLASTTSTIENERFGLRYPGGYQVAAPHPTDAPVATWEPRGTFMPSKSTTVQGGSMCANGNGALSPCDPVVRLGVPEACTAVTSSYFDDAITGRTTELDRDSVLRRVRTEYLAYKVRMQPAVAATLANLKRPPANEDDLEAYAAVWDDGVPCTSVLEYAAAPSDAEQPQVVTCWMPTMRLGISFEGGRNTPYAADWGRYPFRSGDIRYDSRQDEVVPRNPDGSWGQSKDNFSTQRRWILFDRTLRGVWGAWQPYDINNPEWYPGRDTGAAADVAARYATCREDTAEVNDVTEVLVTERLSSPSATVAIERTGPALAQVGGAARPANLGTTTRLVCPNNNCAGPDPAVPPTRLESSSHDLEVDGTAGYQPCATATSTNCDYFVATASGSAEARSAAVWLFRATQGAEALRVEVTNPRATVVRHELTRVWRCPSNYGGQLSRCTLERTEPVRQIRTQVTPSTPGPLEIAVVSATNDPSRRR